MFKLLSILFFINLSGGDSVSCDTIHFKGFYLYEYSPNLSIVDDMVLRESALIQFSNRINYSNGIYFFESDIVSEKDFINCEVIWEKLKYDAIYRHDSIHNILWNLDTEKIVHKGMEYKKVYLEFTAIFLGKREVYVYRKNKIRYKKVPAYLIIDFSEIKPVFSG